MQFVHIAKTGSQQVKPKVATFMGNVECKKHPKAVWKSMSKELQIQVRKLQEFQGIKPLQSRLAPKLGLLLLRQSSELILNQKKVMPRKREGLPKNQHGGGTKKIW